MDEENGSEWTELHHLSVCPERGEVTLPLYNLSETFCFLHLFLSGCSAKVIVLPLPHAKRFVTQKQVDFGTIIEA